MIKNIILKASRSFVKLILPTFSKIFILLRINKRIANFLNEKSFSANNFYDFVSILNDLNKDKKINALDIGAQGGFNSDLFFPEKYNRFFRPIMIEPIKEEAEKLKKKYPLIIDKGLWSSETKKNFIF